MPQALTLTTDPNQADKTIKFWKEDPDATAESHPLNWEPPRDRKRY